MQTSFVNLLPNFAGIEMSGGLEYVSKIMFKTKSQPDPKSGEVATGQSLVWVLMKFMIPVAVFSAFLANIPLVAMMIPPVADYARRVSSGSKPRLFASTSEIVKITCKYLRPMAAEVLSIMHSGNSPAVVTVRFKHTSELGMKTCKYSLKQTRLQLPSLDCKRNEIQVETLNEIVLLLILTCLSSIMCS